MDKGSEGQTQPHKIWTVFPPRALTNAGPAKVTSFFLLISKVSFCPFPPPSLSTVTNIPTVLIKYQVQFSALYISYFYYKVIS